MQGNYGRCLTFVLKHEGGYTNHPADKGGPTKFGITWRVWRDYCHINDLPQTPINRITVEDAGGVYRRNYWNVVAGDWLAAGVDYAVFDGGVNSGTHRGAKWLQRAINRCLPKGEARIKVDGRIGPVTIAAARECSVPALINAICDLRMGMLRHLKKLFPVFGKGWTRRVGEVRQAAKWMAASAATQAANDNQAQVKKAA